MRFTKQSYYQELLTTQPLFPHMASHHEMLSIIHTRPHTGITTMVTWLLHKALALLLSWLVRTGGDAKTATNSPQITPTLLRAVLSQWLLMAVPGLPGRCFEMVDHVGPKTLYHLIMISSSATDQGLALYVATLQQQCTCSRAN